MSVVITRLFDSYEHASQAVGELEASGIPHSDISIVANNQGGEVPASETVEPIEGDASTGAGTGATVGTVLGGGAGLLAGLGMLAIPGIGPVVAAGWLVATVTGAGVGAAAGGLLGALTGAGLSADEAETYAEGVRRGGTLVTARVDDGHADRVMAILARHGSIDLDERAQGWRAEGWTGGTSGAADVPTIEPDTTSGQTPLPAAGHRTAGTPPAPTQTFGSDRR